MADTLAHHAIEYLRAGLHLLALTGKRPNTKWHEQWDWNNSIHGAPAWHDHWGYDYDAACETCRIEDVFDDGRTTGIAILIPEHVLVADIDTEAAAEFYMGLAGEMPDTPVARTKNGLHVWFWHPGADASRWLGVRTLLFKGFGGYVVAPPSQHFDDDGRPDFVYDWNIPLINEHGVVGPLAPLPDGIAAAMQVAEELAGIEGSGDDHWAIQYERVNGKFRLTKEWDLSGLERAIREAPEGNQNNIIAWAALTAQEEGVSYEDAMKYLYTAAVEGGHPAERARTTIRGVYKRRARG